jgi:hypothetical protein
VLPFANLQFVLDSARKRLHTVCQMFGASDPDRGALSLSMLIRP